MWTPQQSLALWPWITSDGSTPDINNPYQGDSSEWGVDTPTHFHTPITSLTSGIVQAAFFGKDINPAYNYGGVVLVLTTIPGMTGMQCIYYLHLDDLAVTKGQHIQVGTLLGLSGGQTSGGDNPVSKQFSSGPHTEVGFNNPDFRAEGGAPDANFDPTPFLNNLLVNGPSALDQLSLISPIGPTLAYLQSVSDQAVTGTGPLNDSFLSIEQAIDSSMAFVPIDFTKLGSAAVSGGFWPWQWGSDAAAIGTEVNTLVHASIHNLAAFGIREMFVVIGMIMLVLVMFSVMKSILDASGIPEATNAAAKAAAPVAAAAL